MGLIRPHDRERRQAIADLHLHINALNLNAMKGNCVNARYHLILYTLLWFLFLVSS